MYDFFYQNGKGHPNCHDTINRVLGESRAMICPVNLFMNSQIDEEGTIKVKPPLSKAGDKIVFRAEIDVRVGIAACSVAGKPMQQRCMHIHPGYCGQRIMCKAIEKAGMEGPYGGLLLGFPLTFLGSRAKVKHITPRV